MSDDYKPQKPDLDLIGMVQKARMMHDAGARPSEMSGVYWIESKDASGKTPAPTPRAGEWVINTSVSDVDALWEKIKTATESGTLGYKSKVSTASKMQKNPNHRVIVVRTYDADDQSDVERVRDALLALGVTGEMMYKR
jgi:hypothetical protein